MKPSMRYSKIPASSVESRGAEVAERKFPVNNGNFGKFGLYFFRVYRLDGCNLRELGVEDISLDI